MCRSRLFTVRKTKSEWFPSPPQLVFILKIGPWKVGLPALNLWQLRIGTGVRFSVSETLPCVRLASGTRLEKHVDIRVCMYMLSFYINSKMCVCMRRGDRENRNENLVPTLAKADGQCRGVFKGFSLILYSLIFNSTLFTIYTYYWPFLPLQHTRVQYLIRKITKFLPIVYC